MHIPQEDIYYEWEYVSVGNRGREEAGAAGNCIAVRLPVEESPDCMEQGVPLKRGMLRTISRRKTSATENIPPNILRDAVRLKWWGKSPPDGSAKAPLSM